MTKDPRRITLVTRGPGSPDRTWDLSPSASSRVIFVNAFSVLQNALRNSVSELAEDVERVIMDRASTATQYLDLLASLPAEFNGDVLFVRYDESAFLSSLGRGGDRVLYSLSAEDVGFYLDMQRLTAPHPAFGHPLPAFAGRGATKPQVPLLPA